MNGSSNPVHRANEAYAKDKLNCAQSVLKGFQVELGISDERISAAKALGGGRAENGRCGALHAALSLADGEEAKSRLACAFSETAGAEACREIKRLGKLNCAACVELAAKLLAGK